MIAFPVLLSGWSKYISFITSMSTSITSEMSNTVEINKWYQSKNPPKKGNRHRYYSPIGTTLSQYIAKLMMQHFLKFALKRQSYVSFILLYERICINPSDPLNFELYVVCSGGRYVTFCHAIIVASINFYILGTGQIFAGDGPPKASSELYYCWRST